MNEYFKHGFEKVAVSNKLIAKAMVSRQAKSGHLGQRLTSKIPGAKAVKAKVMETRMNISDKLMNRAGVPKKVMQKGYVAAGQELYPKGKKTGLISQVKKSIDPEVNRRVAKKMMG